MSMPSMHIIISFKHTLMHVFTSVHEYTSRGKGKEIVANHTAATEQKKETRGTKK